MLNPFTKYLYAAGVLAIAAVLTFTHLSAYRSGRHAVQARWDEAKVATERAAQEQAARNRDLQRQAELHYVVTQQAQDHYFVTTVKEIEHASAPLAACPVPPDVVRLLNDATDCAAGDSPAACGAGQPLPAASQPAGPRDRAGAG